MRGGGLMFWGMIQPNGIVTIKEIFGNLNSDKYIHLLESFAVPCMKLNAKANFNFVQDNCSSHVSKKTKDYFKNQCFSTLPFPPLSPDLNIMENVWKVMTDIIYSQNQPNNIDELRKRICEAHHLINDEKIGTMLNLYSSYRSRLTKILQNHGNLIN